MQKILRKRILREFRENIWRYLALATLIILGMYMIVSMVGAAEVIITGVADSAKQAELEDGEFSVFVPLTENQIKKLEQKGITLEKELYLDIAENQNGIIRIFQNREKINKLVLCQGREAVNEQEIVLERRYCEEHQLSVGDTVAVGKNTYVLAGIGTVPDYDAPYRKLSDCTIDSSQFGLGFVTAKAYETLKTTGASEKSEENVYAYQLGKTCTQDMLRDMLQEMKIAPEEVKDNAFLEYYEENAGKKDDMEEGIDKLADGTEKLKSACRKLCKNNETLKQGAEKLWKAYLEQTSRSLAPYGLPTILTEDNYQEELEKLEAQSESAVLRLSIDSAKDQLTDLKTFRDGIGEYTDAAGEISEGSISLDDGMQTLQKDAEQLMEEYFKTELSNLTEFVTAKENPRINASADDQVINKLAGLIAGVIVMILFTYVISVFVIHNIEQESSVIGALYSMGVKRQELMLHYLMLPVLITALAGLSGSLLGFSKWGIPIQMNDCCSYFSTPPLSLKCPVYLIIYSVFMPPFAAAAVNYIVIRKKLSMTALSLLRNEQKQTKASKIELGNMSFISRFRIRQMLREARSSMTVLAGMFISLLILMLGVDCYVMCEHISTENKEDTRYAYMYTYKYPDQEVTDGGEEGYAKTLKKEIYGYNLDVTVLGIRENNPYFDADVSDDSMEDIVISSAMAQKYGLKTGDDVILHDENEKKSYAFQVKAVTQFSTGLYAFMNIDSMRKLFAAEEDYYNVVFSDKELNIRSDKLYSVTTKEEIEKSSDVFVELMIPMITMLIVVSGIIFAVVMYLMLKVMTDRAAFGISLIKIFGYRIGEIRKLYLNGNFYVIAVGAIICIPLSKKMMDFIFPILVSNVGCAMNLSFSWQLYLLIYAAIIVLYLLMNQLQVMRLKHIVPAEVLKNRE